MSVLVLHQQNRKDQSRVATRRATANAHLYNNVTSMTSVTEDLDTPLNEVVEEINNTVVSGPPPQPVSRALKSARLQKIDKSWTNLNLDTQYSLVTNEEKPQFSPPSKQEKSSFLSPMETAKSPVKSTKRESISAATSHGEQSSSNQFDNAKLRKELEALDRQIANEKIE